MRLQKIAWWTLGAVALLLLVFQFVPVGAKTNPPIRSEPRWDSVQTRALVERACFDCHSNETVWPWYSHVAPASWLVVRDVNLGREELNFSEWASSEEAHEIIESIQDGSMPMRAYLITHPEARLTAQEKAALTTGLQRSLGSSSSPREGHDD